MVSGPVGCIVQFAQCHNGGLCVVVGRGLEVAFARCLPGKMGAEGRHGNWYTRRKQDWKVARGEGEWVVAKQHVKGR